MKTTDRKMLLEAMDFAIENNVCFEYKPHINGFGFYNYRSGIASDSVYFNWTTKRSRFNKVKKQMLK